MKKSLFVLLMLSLLAGCSGLPPISLPFLQSPTPPPPPQPTATPFSLQPTHTLDLFVINTSEPTTTAETGTPLATQTPLPTFTITARPTITLEPLDPTLFTPSPNLFLNVQRDTSQLVWGGNCAGAEWDRAVAGRAPGGRERLTIHTRRRRRERSA